MNLVVVMMDTLRTDHVGAYGGKNAKARTPNMDRFAEQALVFENVGSRVLRLPERLLTRIQRRREC